MTPPWLAAPFLPGRTIVIDPAMAFGTGHHDTTRGCLLALDRMSEDDPELEVMTRQNMLDRHESFRGLRCILTTEEGQLALTLDGIPVFDNDGVFTGYRGSARDTTAAAKAELKKTAQTVRSRGGLVYVSGFAGRDELGSVWLVQSLARMRAEVVAKYLSTLGVRQWITFGGATAPNSQWDPSRVRRVVVSTDTVINQA